MHPNDHNGLDLLAELQNRTKAKALSKVKGTGRQQFMVLQADIEQALKDYPIIDIWQTLTERQQITISYRGFCKYVQKLIKKPQPIPSERRTATPKNESPVPKRNDHDMLPRPKTGYIHKSDSSEAIDFVKPLDQTIKK